MNAHTVDVAEDRTLISGIYEHCDQWCSYCAMTARCLAYRRLLQRQEQHGTAFRTLDEVIEFTREVKAEEGTLTP